MAWDLRYTSVESGPTGRSGFQFVATTPGTPPEVTRAVTPYMAYRPPPDAPSAPDPEQLARFPAAFAYGREGDHTVLVRCRYTGRDYSGRYGNFSGHAVVATPAEMEGLRPIELWASPVWSGPPGGAPDLVPGEAFDPDSLVAWLGREGAHARLAALLDAVMSALSGGHGRVVLVSEDDGLIARWIALLSYSLPASLAAAMSFTTYTATPESAPQLVVGTVPGAWPGLAFHLDEPAADAPDHDAPGRFARVIADCWRTGDLDGIDAVGELLTVATGSTGSTGEWNTDLPSGGGIPRADPESGSTPRTPKSRRDPASDSIPRTPEGRSDAASGRTPRTPESRRDAMSGNTPRTPEDRRDTTSGNTPSTPESRRDAASGNTPRTPKDRRDTASANVPSTPKDRWDAASASTPEDPRNAASGNTPSTPESRRDAMSGNTPRTPEGRWEATSGTLAAAADGGARARPVVAGGMLGAADGAA
ncbi:MAG: hypothetical protein ACRDP6_20545, partial [Actinoallomurus sp.]